MLLLRRQFSFNRCLTFHCQFTLLRLGSTQLAAQDPAKRGLLDKKEELEQAIDKLKYEKAAMPLEEYREQLTGLLVELGKTQRAIDAE